MFLFYEHMCLSVLDFYYFAVVNCQLCLYNSLYWSISITSFCISIKRLIYATRKCGVVIRLVAFVCLCCSGFTFWMLWPTNLIFGMQVFRTPTQGRVSRSWGQGQGHTSVTKCMRSMMVCLRLEDKLVLTLFCYTNMMSHVTITAKSSFVKTVFNLIYKYVLT